MQFSTDWATRKFCHKMKIQTKMVLWLKLKRLRAQPRYPICTGCTSDVLILTSSTSQPSQWFCYILCMQMGLIYLTVSPIYPNFALSILYQACLHKLKMHSLPCPLAFFRPPLRGEVKPFLSPALSGLLSKQNIFTQSEGTAFCSFLFDAFLVRQDQMRLKAQKTPCCVPCIKCTFSYTRKSLTWHIFFINIYL